MKKLDLLKLANQGYPDAYLAEYFWPETGDYRAEGFGDHLAEFIVCELLDTFDPEVSDQEQADTAYNALHSAVSDLRSVMAVLQAPAPARRT